MRESFEDDGMEVDAVIDFVIPADAETLALVVVTTTGVSIQSNISEEILSRALLHTVAHLGSQS